MCCEHHQALKDLFLAGAITNGQPIPSPESLAAVDTNYTPEQAQKAASSWMKLFVMAGRAEAVMSIIKLLPNESAEDISEAMRTRQSL